MLVDRAAHLQRQFGRQKAVRDDQWRAWHSPPRQRRRMTVISAFPPIWSFSWLIIDRRKEGPMRRRTPDPSPTTLLALSLNGLLCSGILDRRFRMKLAECTDFSIKLCRDSPVVGGASSEPARGAARSRRWSRLLGLGSVIAVVAAPSAAVNAEELASGLAKPTGFSARTPGDSPFNTQLAQSRSELQRDADQLFEQLLKDPKNIDLTLRYAEAVAKLGNLEAAISSLERLLLLDRNYPGVRLQLAELYRRLNSFEMARSYLTQAEQEPGAGEQARARIQALRADIDRASSGSRFAVNLVTGLRYQTNASAEPAGADIIAGGVPQTLSTVFRGKPGWDLCATGNVQHSYDLGDGKLETNGLAYVSQQFAHSWLNVAALEVNSGPRFDISG